MTTIYGTSEFVDTSTRAGISSLLTALWSEFQASRRRRRIRAQLYSLNDWELADIGVAPGEIEHIALYGPSDRARF
jgi:uncharacterized protein YjiS (DUF1127 family)